MFQKSWSGVYLIVPFHPCKHEKCTTYILRILYILTDLIYYVINLITHSLHFIIYGLKVYPLAIKIKRFSSFYLHLESNTLIFGKLSDKFTSNIDNRLFFVSPNEETFKIVIEHFYSEIWYRKNKPIVMK
jgi:hypothetical protein